MKVILSERGKELFLCQSYTFSCTPGASTSKNTPFGYASDLTLFIYKLQSISIQFEILFH